MFLFPVLLCNSRGNFSPEERKLMKIKKREKKRFFSSFHCVNCFLNVRSPFGSFLNSVELYLLPHVARQGCAEAGRKCVAIFVGGRSEKRRRTFGLLSTLEFIGNSIKAPEWSVIVNQ